MSLKLQSKLASKVEKFLQRAQQHRTAPQPPSRTRPARADAFEAAIPRRAFTGASAALPEQYPLMERAAPAYDAQKAARIVDDLYLGVLGRPADPEGAAVYRPLVEQGQLSVVVNAFVQSEEFRARARTVDATTLATDLYKGILWLSGRASSYRETCW